VAMFFVETYPSNKAINALENAKNRGVDVKLIFSNHTLASFPSTDDDLTARGIPFKVIPNHAKLVVIDNKVAYIGSANWNKNGLENNRELGIKTNNANTVAEVTQYINTLWNTGNAVVNQQERYYERFANGEEYYNLLLNDLHNANSVKVLMFAMTYDFSDPEGVDTKILNEIKFAYEHGANMQIVLDDPRYFETFGGRQFLTKENIPHNLDYKNSGPLQRMHTKAVLIDNEILYIGSQNWTFDALDSPVEASLITRDSQAIADYQAIFDNEWALSHAP
jgi:phosphatidylserine/phosphatidylglycerophosphate/cardiolipin synthase-like enzyme